MCMDNLSYMKEHLESISSNGIALYLEGRRVTAEELAWTCCVNEDEIYMPDIIANDIGQVEAVRYDKIKVS